MQTTLIHKDNRSLGQNGVAIPHNPSEWGDIREFPWSSSMLASESREKVVDMVPPEFQSLARTALTFCDSWADNEYKAGNSSLVATVRRDVRVESQKRRPTLHALMLYILLDKLHSVCAPNDSAGVAQVERRRLPIEPTSKRSNASFFGGINALADWSKVLVARKEDASRDREERLPTAGAQQLVERDTGLFGSLMQCIDRRRSKVKFQNTLLNMEMAALFLRVLLRGSPDLPANADRMIDFLTRHGESTDGLELHRRYNAVKWRGPLYAALAISPLLLISGTSMAANDISRNLLHWIALGNQKPPELREVEDTLWTEISHMALSHKSAEAALEDFLARCERIRPDLSGFAAEAVTFFSAEYTEHPLREMHSNSSKVNLLDSYLMDVNVPASDATSLLSTQPDPPHREKEPDTASLPGAQQAGTSASAASLAPPAQAPEPLSQPDVPPPGLHDSLAQPQCSKEGQPAPLHLCEENRVEGRCSQIPSSMGDNADDSAIQWFVVHHAEEVHFSGDSMEVDTDGWSDSDSKAVIPTPLPEGAEQLALEGADSSHHTGKPNIAPHCAEADNGDDSAIRWSVVYHLEEVVLNTDNIDVDTDGWSDDESGAVIPTPLPEGTEKLGDEADSSYGDVLLDSDEPNVAPPCAEVDNGDDSAIRWSVVYHLEEGYSNTEKIDVDTDGWSDDESDAIIPTPLPDGAEKLGQEGADSSYSDLLRDTDQPKMAPQCADVDNGDDSAIRWFVGYHLEGVEFDTGKIDVDTDGWSDDESDSGGVSDLTDLEESSTADEVPGPRRSARNHDKGQNESPSMRESEEEDDYEADEEDSFADEQSAASEDGSHGEETVLSKSKIAPGASKDERVPLLSRGASREPFVGECYFFYVGPGVSFSHMPERYEQGDIDDFDYLVRLSGESCRSDIRPHRAEEPHVNLSTTSEPLYSFVDVYTFGEYQRLGSEERQERFALKPLIIRDGPHAEDGRCLHDLVCSIGSIFTPRTIHDLSLLGLSERADYVHREGTLNDVLHEASKKKKMRPLNVLSLPGTGMASWMPWGLSTDDVAYRHCNDLRPDGDEPLPLFIRDITWSLFATRHAFHTAHVDACGFATIITVLFGYKLVFILTPKNSNDWTDMAKLDYFRHLDMNERNGLDWKVSYVLLKPGDSIVMPPMLVHYVVTPETAVCHGGHFFSMPTIRRSCWALLHLLHQERTFTNTSHPCHRVMLARIVEYWHDIITNHSHWYIEQCSTATSLVANLPNLLTFTGVMDLLTVLNIMDFRSALWGERYEEPTVLPRNDMKAYSTARQHGDEIIQWFEQRWVICGFTFEGSNGKPSMRTTASIRDVRISFLIQQACTLLRQAKECREPSLQAVKAAIHAEFKDRDPKLYNGLLAAEKAKPLETVVLPGGFVYCPTHSESYSWEHECPVDGVWFAVAHKRNEVKCPVDHTYLRLMLARLGRAPNTTASAWVLLGESDTDGDENMPLASRSSKRSRASPQSMRKKRRRG